MSGKQQLFIHVAEITIFSISLILLYKKISNVSDRVDTHEKKLDEIMDRLNMMTKLLSSQPPPPRQSPPPSTPLPVPPPKVSQPTPPSTPDLQRKLIFEFPRPQPELATIEEVDLNDKNLDEELSEEMKDLDINL